MPSDLDVKMALAAITIYTLPLVMGSNYLKVV